MNKLIAANFMRMKKSKVFWVCMAFMIGYAFLLIVSNYRAVKERGEISPDGSILSFAPFIGIVVSVFTGLFLGTEYSDGTIRNKVIIGHSRVSIYFANLIACIAAGIAFCVMYLLVYTVGSVWITGWFTMEPKSILVMLLLVAVLTIAFCSIFTALSMLNQNKAMIAVVSLLLSFVILFTGSYILNRLSEPEYYGGYMLNSQGAVEEMQPEKNPRYLSGTKRQVYEFFNDFLPGGQQLQAASMEVAHPWRLMGYSAVITIVATAAGILVFRRKDLK